ncbi:MAG: glycosyltransferase family 4 protein [Actinobacteria bacterium]|nr:glycosyltransferase family 4 protein [Actinomycetota bacterium]
MYRNFRRLVRGDTCLDSSSFFFEYPSGRASIAWLMLKPLKRFRWVKVIHDGSLPTRYDNFGFKQKLLFKILIRFVDEFIVVSEDLHIWLRDIIRVKQKVSLIKSLLPIPPESFNAPLPVEIEQAIAHHDKVICSIGVFTPVYGFKDIAAAIESVRQESGLDIGLLLVDGSFAIDEDYKSEVLWQREWVTVVTNLPHPQVLQVLKRSDIFVRGVALESYGLSRVESLWCGTPVVATRMGETRGMLLYDYGDGEMLIQQIKEALFNPPMQNIRIWAERFECEAEDNLQAMLNILSPDRGPYDR